MNKNATKFKFLANINLFSLRMILCRKFYNTRIHYTRDDKRSPSEREDLYDDENDSAHIRPGLDPRSVNPTNASDPRSNYVFKKYSTKSYNDYPNQDTNRPGLDMKKENIEKDLKEKESIFRSPSIFYKPYEPGTYSDVLKGKPDYSKSREDRNLERQDDYIADDMNRHNKEREEYFKKLKSN